MNERVAVTVDGGGEGKRGATSAVSCAVTAGLAAEGELRLSMRKDNEWLIAQKEGDDEKKRERVGREMTAL